MPKHSRRIANITQPSYITDTLDQQLLPFNSFIFLYFGHKESSHTRERTHTKPNERRNTEAGISQPSKWINRFNANMHAEPKRTNKHARMRQTERENTCDGKDSTYKSYNNLLKVRNIVGETISKQCRDF